MRAFGTRRALCEQLVADGETRAATHATAAEKLTRDGPDAFAQLRDAQHRAGQPPSDTRLVDSLLSADASLSAVMQPLAQAYKAAAATTASQKTRARLQQTASESDGQSARRVHCGS